MAVSGGIGALRVRRPGDANDRAPAETDWHARFVRSLNGFVRVGYELCTFVIIWVLAYEAMVLKRALLIRYEAATTGVSIAQIMDRQNASGGMWAFAEGNEVMLCEIAIDVPQARCRQLPGRRSTVQNRHASSAVRTGYNCAHRCRLPRAPNSGRTRSYRQ